MDDALTRACDCVEQTYRQALIDQAVRNCVVIPRHVKPGQYISYDEAEIRAEFRRLQSEQEAKQ